MSPGLSSWIHEALPKKGSGVKAELQCYSFPYGVLGFVSHILTYWTVALLSRGRSPFTLRKNKRWKFDVALAAFSILFSLPLSIFTIVRCRARWDFILLGIWKASMSLSLGLISMHAVLQVRRQDSSKEKVPWWVIVYVPGFFAGTIGLGSLINDDWNAWMGKKEIMISTSFLLALIATLGVLSSGMGIDRLERMAHGYASVPVKGY